MDDDKDMNQVDNFYNYKTGRLLLNDYKTSAIYEPYDVVFSKYVRDAISESLKQKPREYLIEKQEGGVYAKQFLEQDREGYL